MADRLREMKIFSGSAHPEFAQRVSENLRVPLSIAKVGRFSDGEVSVSIEESVRGADVYVIQPTCPGDENLMELLILIDALKRASGLSDKRGDALLRLCQAGQEDAVARTDHGEARREPLERSWSQSRHIRRPPCGADPGFL